MSGPGKKDGTSDLDLPSEMEDRPALTNAEREALRTSGSWPNVGTDLFTAIERILAARFGRVRELADEWERSGRPRIGGSEAAEELRAALGGVVVPQKQVACTACDQGYPASACSSKCDCGAC